MYAFTTERPPLLEQDGDVLSIPQDALREIVGQEEWTDTVEQPPKGFPSLFSRTITTYSVSRIKRWVAAEHPIHFAEAVTTRTTTTTGYKKTERSAVERTLNLDVSTAVPFSGLNASIKAGLKLTNETTQEWREEVVTTVDITYRKNTTYVGWKLIDTVIAKQVRKLELMVGKAKNVVKTETSSAEAALDVILRYYQDSIDDEDKNQFQVAAVALAENPGIMDIRKIAGF